MGGEKISRATTKDLYGTPLRVSRDDTNGTEQWWYFAFEGISSGWEGPTPKCLEWFIEFPIDGELGVTSGTGGRRFMITEVTDR